MDNGVAEPRNLEQNIVCVPPNGDSTHLFPGQYVVRRELTRELLLHVQSPVFADRFPGLE
jgi:hypothetical protein